MSAATLEKQAAETLAKLNGLMEGENSLPAKMKLLEQEVESLKGMNIKGAVEEFEKLKASHETVIKHIRASKRGLHVPGLADEGEKFSMLRAMVAVRTGDWRNAGFEKEAFKAIDGVVQKTQIIGDDKMGGYFVPDQLIPEVIAAIYTRSVFVGLEDSGETNVSILDGLTGANVKVPKFDGGLIAYWIGEEDEYAESNATVGDVTLNPKKLGILVAITDSMRRLQGFGFETLLRRDMTRAAAKKLDWTIGFGNGSADMPRGIVHHQGIKIYRAEDKTVLTPAAAAAVADWDGGEVDFDGLDNMMLALEEDDITLDESHRWISAPRYFKRLKQLKTLNFSGQTTGQPYLLGLPMLPDARLAEIIGKFSRSTQIKSNEKPGAAINGATDSANLKYTTIFGGNLNNVVLGRWGGIEIEDDAGRGKGFTSDKTYMKLRLYADVAIRQERSIIVCPDAKARD